MMQELSCVPDLRKRKKYAIAELLMGGLGMFLFRQDFHNEINNKRREAGFSKSFERCFGTRLAHGDSIADVLCQLDPDSLEEVKMNLIGGAFRTEVPAQAPSFGQVLPRGGGRHRGDGL
jgi:hypothetical protein